MPLYWYIGARIPRTILARFVEGRPIRSVSSSAMSEIVPPHISSIIPKRLPRRLLSILSVL